MSLIERHRELIAAYLVIEDSTERLSAIVERGRRAPPLPEEARDDSRLVPGCSSRVWLEGWLDGAGACQFRAEADAPVVHAVAALLCALYSGALPPEVEAVEPDCLDALGIHRHLTPTRQRGIGQVRRRIREIAASLGGAGPTACP